MKKKLLIFLFIPLAIASAISCKKLIEIEETDFMDAELALTSLENNQQAVIGAYGTLGIEMAIQMNGVFSDELKPGEFYASQSTHEWQYTSNDISIRDNYTATTAYYYVINRVNRVLQALPDIEPLNVAEDSVKKRTLGEALFLRAFCHFELYRYYCANYDPSGLAMPYVKIVTKAFPGPGFARIPMSNYFDSLENDLAEAKSLVIPHMLDIYRVNKVAVSGLQARVALYKKDYANAATYASEYLDSLPLATGAAFDAIWKDGNKQEVAFKLKRTNSSRVGSFYRSLFTKTSAGKLVAPTSITWVPSGKLWDTYDTTNDRRYRAYLIEEPLLKAINNKPYKIVNKYSGGAYASNTENVGDLKIMRSAEMALIRAEARAELGQFTGASSAESDINDLRTARITGYTPVTFASKQEAIDAIMLERYKELAFEGHRFWDLKRRGLAIERLGSDAPTPAGLTLSAGNFRFLLPIPQAEMLANPQMEQNPGYAN